MDSSTTDNEKPLLALDIDDVLNHRHMSPYHEYLLTVETKYLARTPFTNSFPGPTVELTVNIPSVYPSWIKELQGLYDLVWASTWELAANRYISPLLGLDEIPVVEFSKNQPTPTEIRRNDIAGWKLRSIIDFAGPRRFAFVDDAAYSPKLRSLARSLNPPALIVAPSRGLTSEQVDILINWAQPDL